MAGTARFPIDPPHWVDARLAALRARGGQTWLVGGTVRDALLGRPVDDFDAATDLPPDVVAQALPSADDRDAGIGAVACRGPDGALTITTLRRESDYGLDRRPRRVEFVRDPRVDALRRDFTVNALYVELPGAAVLDPVGGLDDLAARRLRVIGEPALRLAEDPLRVLRALRFAAVLGFALDPELGAALPATAAGVRALSAARRGAEIVAALAGAPTPAARSTFLTSLVAYGLADAAFDGRNAADVARVAAALAAHRGGVAGALALLADPTDPDRARDLLDRLAPPAPLRRAALGLVRATAAFRAGGAGAGAGSVRPVDGDELGAILAALGSLDAPQDRERFALLRARLDGRLDDLVRAADLRALGVADGPDLGRLLAAARDAVARAGVCDPESVRGIVRRTVASAVKPDPSLDDRRA